MCVSGSVRLTVARFDVNRERMRAWESPIVAQQLLERLDLVTRVREKSIIDLTSATNEFYLGPTRVAVVADVVVAVIRSAID